MIPKIEFNYSGQYNELFKNYLGLKYKLSKNHELKKILDNYPTENKILSYIKMIGKYWKNEEKEILNSIEKITGLKWREDIKVYMVGKCIPFSKPLTMCIDFSKLDFRDTLTHELIHVIQSQNKPIYKKWNDYVTKNYPKEDIITRNHIFLHAVHKNIYLSLFNKKRLMKNIQKSSHNEPYKIAWEIVEKEGCENIIKKFKELTT